MGEADEPVKPKRSRLDEDDEDENGKNVEVAEATGLSKLLGHPTKKTCWMCHAVVPSMSVDMDVLKLRSELCDFLREDSAAVSKPGLLRHLLITDEERLKLEGDAPRSKL